MRRSVRQVNEQIEQLDQASEESSFTGPEGIFEFLCECGRAEGDDIACEARVEMTLEEYEAVRAEDDRFALSPGHENPAIEDVVRTTDPVSSSIRRRLRSR